LSTSLSGGGAPTPVGGSTSAGGGTTASGSSLLTFVALGVIGGLFLISVFLTLARCVSRRAQQRAFARAQAQAAAAAATHGHMPPIHGPAVGHLHIAVPHHAYGNPTVAVRPTGTLV
jgi:hypothetical protein